MPLHMDFYSHVQNYWRIVIFSSEMTFHSTRNWFTEYLVKYISVEEAVILGDTERKSAAHKLCFMKNHSISKAQAQ